MERRDIASSLFLLALGTSFIAGSFTYSISSRYGPGPGFFPLLFGILLDLLSILLLIDGMRRFYRARDKKRVGSEVVGFANSHKIVAYLLCCGCVYLAMKPLGFLITIFVFLVVALPLAGQKSFRTILAVAATASVSIFLLFLELKVPLPSGPLKSLAGPWGH